VPSAESRAADPDLLTVVELEPTLVGIPRAIIEAVFAQLALSAAAERRGIRLGDFTYNDLGTKIA
jgi:hypothetical protein